MKRIKHIILLLLMFVCCIFFVGCTTNISTMPSSVREGHEHKAMVPIEEGSYLKDTEVTTGVKGKFVSVLLPLSGPLATSGQAIRNGFLAGHFYAQKKGRDAFKIQFLDTNRYDIETIYSKAQALGAGFIVGPLTKSDVEKVASKASSSVPTLSLNTLYGSTKVGGNFYQFGLSPQDEAIQVAHRMLRDGHKKVLVFAPENSWSKNLVVTFRYNFERLGGKVVSEGFYDKPKEFSEKITSLLGVNQELLQAQRKNKKHENFDLALYRRQDFDAIFMIANPQDARLIRPLLKFYFAGSVPLYATSQVYAGHPNPQQDFDLDGIIFCDLPWILKSAAKLPPYLREVGTQITSVWANTSLQDSKLYALGLDAYNLMRFLGKESAYPSQGLLGATGTLFLDKNNHIYRDLDWAVFKHGRPFLLP